jgi:amino acid transporter
MTNIGSSGEQRIFLRKASGLIRAVGPFDTLIYNIGTVSVGLGVGTMMLYGPAYYPGGDLIAGCILAAVVMAFIAFGMITWSITLPRSGGVYVFGSRSMYPFLALTMSMVEIVTWLFYCAIAAYWIILLGVNPTLATIGYVTGATWAIDAAGWVVQPWPLFIIGSAILIVSGLLINSGMKAYLLSQKIVFITSMAGSLLLIVVLLTGSNVDFVAEFNRIMGPVLALPDPYNAIIEAGKANGWTTEGADWKTTLAVSNWAFLPLLGAAFSIAIAGEIKSIEKSQFYGMMGAIAGTLVIWLITIPLASSVFGYEFLGTAQFNQPPFGTGLTTPTTPAITLLAGILTDSWLVTLLVSIGFMTWIWMWIPGMHTYGVRAMVAWSFDRIAPAQIGMISPTRHTPSFAIWVAVAITVFFMALFCFTSFFSTIIVLIEAACLAWSVILLAGVFFPYTRPRIYEKSPIAGKKILGLPMMTVACAMGFLASQFYFWNLWSDPIAAGHDWAQMQWVLGIFIFGIAFYFVMKAIRRSQGVDVTLAFKEIPIE